MIIEKRSVPLKFPFENGELGDLRKRAFDIYGNFLKERDGKDLLLLESLGVNSIDSRVSVIGIDPVLNISVIDCAVTITGNQQLLNKIAMVYIDEKLVDLSDHRLVYQMTSRKLIWDFLRKIDDSFKSINGGVMAFISMSYNAVYYIEDLPGYKSDDFPEINICCYGCCIEIEEHAAWMHFYDFIGAQPTDESKILSSIHLDPKREFSTDPVKFSIQRETSKDEYLAKTIKALHHVEIGDVYQVQVGQKINVNANISPVDVYARLRKLNPSPYMYLFSIQDTTVIGASPELFARVKEGRVLMRPIAGTLGKAEGITREIARDELHGNEKEVAEHLMLIDLCRNDLCRISIPSSLEVSGVMEIEEYSHVYHMVSTAEASLRVGVDKYDVIKASFPAGTMTGTPKIRAMELIAEVEDSGRGLYAGALGMIGLGTDFLNTALCIRTAMEKNGTYTLRASAGIVSDSVPEKEHAETLHKMGSMFRAITGEEISCYAV